MNHRCARTSGLPVLTLPHRTLSEFVEVQKVGLLTDGFDMKEKLAESEAIHDNGIKKRYEFTIENNVNQLIQLYTNLITARAKFHSTILTRLPSA